jgi:hypothetical protein
MMATNLLILGMNRLSTSLGLVMKNGNNIHRIGFDPDISGLPYRQERSIK